MKPETNIARLITVVRETVTGPEAKNKRLPDGPGGGCPSAVSKKDGADSSNSPIGAAENRAESFKKIVEAVIKANKRAQSSKTGESEIASPDVQALANALQAASGAAGSIDDFALLGLSLLNGKSVLSDGMTPETPLNASEIIQNALVAISQTLKLTVPQGLQNVNLNNPSEAVKEQIAEILVALKGINSLLNEAVQTNQPITINDAVLEPAQALSIEQILRVETFHIEMALASAGISGDISNLLALKNNSAAPGNIITAMEPALVSMPPSQVKQALGNGIASKEKTVETLLKNLAASLQTGASTPEKSVLVSKIAAVIVVNAQQTDATARVIADSDNKGAAGPFDAKVLRTLLKIDKTEGENKNAAQGAEKINAPDSLKALFAKDLSVAAANHDGKAAGAMVDAGIVKNADAFMAGSDVRGLTTSKTLEESVVGQLSDKVQIAVKTGVTEIRLLLRPESLGEMRVKLTLDGDVVMGKIYVENQQVKHIIENNMQSLKDSLAQHNLQTGAFDVDVGGGERDQTRDMADMARANIQEGSGERRAAPNPQPTDDLSMGRETGRRYGSNTIEFFA
jgi:flagellar hook-length control protein FliK